MATASRLESVDCFRGLAIVAMVLANFLNDVQTIPAWLRHARGVGLTPSDLVAPAFVFAIGLTFGPSFARRRERDGLAATVGHFLKRALVLLGIGCILSAGEVATGVNTRGPAWGVLQSLGAAIILVLPALAIRPLPRVGLGLGLLAAYQLLLDRAWLDVVTSSPHGGLQGCLAWGAMLALATAVADLGFGGRRGIGVALSALALAGGLLLSSAVPIAKERVSASYVLVGLGASGLLYALVALAVDRLRWRSALLADWGRNPLLLYVIQMFLLAVVVLPPWPAWHVLSPPWLAAAQAAALLAVLSGVARALARRCVYVSL